ncbi:Squalene/phytoene synthase [compost metagenome]
MCLQVFVEGDTNLFNRLKPQAMKLGAAFQKVNFLRDLRDDFQLLGRSYFPDIQMTQFSDQVKNDIEKDIQRDFDQALEGIRRLPTSSRFGVYLAYKYYLSLFRKIKQSSAKRIMEKRIRIPNRHKISLAMSSYFHYKISIA